MESRKIHLELNMENEKERRAYEILQEVRKTGMIKTYIVRAVLQAEAGAETLDMKIKDFEERIRSLEKETERICRMGGIPKP